MFAVCVKCLLGLAATGLFFWVQTGQNPANPSPPIEQGKPVLPLVELIKQLEAIDKEIFKKDEARRGILTETLQRVAEIPTPAQRKILAGMATGRLELACGDVKIAFIYVPPGEYQFGRSDADKIQANLKTNGMFANNSAPQTPVYVREGFFLSETEITRNQYRHYIKKVFADSAIFNNPKSAVDTVKSNDIKPTNENPFVQPRNPIPWMQSSEKDSESDQNLPANNVSWFEAFAMSAWLHSWNGVVVRLPSEIEWEYAAKGRGNHRFPRADAQDFRPTVGNSPLEVKRDPNDISWCGIRDMAGNVSEWCIEPYKADFHTSINQHAQKQGGTHSHYPSKVPLVPGTYKTPPGGESRTYKGGSFGLDEVLCESSNRNSRIEVDRLGNIGFRLLVPLPAGIPGIDQAVGPELLKSK